MSEYMKEAERLIEDYGNAEWKVGRMSEHSDDAEEIVTRENARAALLAHIRRGVPAPAEVPMPEPVGTRFDGTKLLKEADVHTYGDAREAAGYARGLELYNQLLFAVATKHPDETRHETALRYIRQAEESRNSGCQAA